MKTIIFSAVLIAAIMATGCNKDNSMVPNPGPASIEVEDLFDNDNSQVSPDETAGPNSEPSGSDSADPDKEVNIGSGSANTYLVSPTNGGSMSTGGPVTSAGTPLRTKEKAR